MRMLALTFVILSACGAQPAPEFMWSERVDLRQDGRDYTVFYTDSRVEVIRKGWASRGEHQAIRATMINMIEAVTGCTLVASTLTGDSGEMRGSISC